MDDTQQPLLDYPKRAHLLGQSTELRAALKAFERTFAEHNGRKPKQNDIKNDPPAAAKYRQYHKVQDVLAGKLAYEALDETKSRTKSRSGTHSRQDSGIGSSPREQQRSLQLTPKKSPRPFELDPYDAPSSASPKPMLMSAIGPTPHRDGKVLGLFDLLQRSGSGKSAIATPSSSARKRKIDELYQDTPARRSPLKPIQSPSHRSSKKHGDLLQFLGETPQKGSEGPMGKHSRTPQSEGKKFQLSQFFATPSTQRFLFSAEDSSNKKKTPRRDMVLGQTPPKQPFTTGLDRTPTYLRRSTSFKDRLLSASKATSAPDFSQSPPRKRIGPPTLRHFRSSTNNILTISDIPQQPTQQRQCPKHVDDDHDDELEAMRELEGQEGSPDVLVEDSQLNIQPLVSQDETDPQPIRPYKKKGQKRTTRKSTIRPTSQAKPSAQPKFVAADGSDEDDEENHQEAIEETKLMSDDDDDSDFEGPAAEDVELTSRAKRRKELGWKEKPTKTAVKSKKQAGRINPNAQSHQNFRSLKIKGKSATVKGPGRGKFGRGRR